MYKISSQRVLSLAVSLTTALALSVAPTATRAGAVAARSTAGTLFADWSATDSTGRIITQATASAGESTVCEDGTV